MTSELPVRQPSSESPAAVTLLNDLQANLWSSLRHTIDLDRVTLSALWLSNLGGMVLTIIAGHKPVPFIATVAALGVVDVFIYRIFHSSREETRRLVLLLTDIYTDHGLGKYFDQLREQFFVERYGIRLALCPALFVLALLLGLAFSSSGW